jgi:predicted XRE-type DNA-binding protein
MTKKQIKTTKKALALKTKETVIETDTSIQKPVQKRRYFHHLIRNIDEMRLSWFMAGKNNHFGKNKLVTKLAELMKVVKKD